MATPSALELLLRELLAQVTASSMPNAAALREYLAPRARAVTFANENLEHPKWASGTSDEAATFVELDGDVLGVQLWDDSRGWGARVEITVDNATREDMERVTGPTHALPRMPHRPERIAADVATTAGRVIVSADHLDGRVNAILVQFNVRPARR